MLNLFQHPWMRHFGKAGVSNGTLRW